MARGWESKDVESQREAAESGHPGDRPISRDPAEVERNARRQSLLLSRTRILRELAETHHERRKEQLQAALDYLDHELKELSAGGG